LAEAGLPTDSILSRIVADPAVVDSIKRAYQRVEASLVAIDPRTGHVKAWVGGRDFAQNKYDHVSMSKRQPGSTFKPFVYAAALDYGFSPDDVLLDEIVEYVDPQTHRRWAPRNVGRVSGEPTSLRDALAFSKNTITAQLTLQLGPDRVASYAQRMGIESEMQRYPSIGLGTSEVTLLELVSAYGTIASLGTHRDPVVVTRIEDRHGRTLATFPTESQGALSPHTTYTLLDMMRGVVDYGTGARIRSVFGASGDLAAKTGTSQDGADGWFVLMHPQLVTGAWVGFSSPAVTFRSSYWGQGAHNALYVVGDFYRDADLPRDVRFEAPAGYRVPQATQFAYASEDSLGDDLFGDSLAWGDYDTLDWRDVEDLDLSDSELDAAARDTADAELAGEEAPVPEDELTEADRLNRMEREQNGVGRLLDEIQEDGSD
ncbi:MAG TPA: penicillin-binding transpeptidase domain-containing protein, partial [Rhodothermales bacterium]